MAILPSPATARQLHFEHDLIVPLTDRYNLATTTIATAPFTGTTIYLRTGLDFIRTLELALQCDGKLGRNWEANSNSPMTGNGNIQGAYAFSVTTATGAVTLT